MSITQMKIVVTVVGFVLIFLTGYWLYRNGQHKSSADLGGSDLSVPEGEQPFNVAVLTIHKLLSVALIVYLVVIVLSINKIVPLSRVELIACIVTGLLFLGAVASGGVLSAAKTMPDFVRMLHKLLPALTFLSTAVTFYFFVHRK